MWLMLKCSLSKHNLIFGLNDVLWINTDTEPLVAWSQSWHCKNPFQCQGFQMMQFLVNWTLFSIYWRHFATPLNGFITCLMKLMYHHDVTQLLKSHNSRKVTVRNTKSKENYTYYKICLYGLFSFKINKSEWIFISCQYKTMSIEETRVKFGLTG